MPCNSRKIYLHCPFQTHSDAGVWRTNGDCINFHTMEPIPDADCVFKYEQHISNRALSAARQKLSVLHPSCHMARARVQATPAKNTTTYHSPVSQTICQLTHNHWCAVWGFKWKRKTDREAAGSICTCLLMKPTV